MLYDMLLLKILNVSERTRMSVVPRSSEFATQTRRQNAQGRVGY